MTAPAETAELAPGPSPVAAVPARTRPFYWSVRRELWENRSLYIAPAVVAGVVLFGFLVRAGGLPGRLRGLAGADPARAAHMAALPFALSALVILVAGGLAGAFYALGALHGERRDRSILFWKSLPVSDLTAVLAKVAMPMAILPAIVFAMIVATHLIMLVVGGGILLASGMDAGALWATWPFVHMTGLMAYAMVVLSLWYAPIWGWLLLVSAWARRVTVLWALAPPFAICVFEKIAFDTGYFGQMLKVRLAGGMAAGFKFSPGAHDVFDMLRPDPLGFVLDPGVWGGLIAAVACLAGAVWLRRNREPI